MLACIAPPLPLGVAREPAPASDGPAMCRPSEAGAARQPRTDQRFRRRAPPAVAVDAGRVAVGPDRRQSVAPHLLEIDHLGLLLAEHLDPRQHAGHVALAGALRAGAGPAQRLEAVDGLMTVVPPNAHEPLIDVDLDVEWLQGAVGVLHRGSLLPLS